MRPVILHYEDIGTNKDLLHNMICFFAFASTPNLLFLSPIEMVGRGKTTCLKVNLPINPFHLKYSIFLLKS